MQSYERVAKTLNFEKVDRMPVIEWAPYWDETITRWQGEGLPIKTWDPQATRDYFGLDQMQSIWVVSENSRCPQAEYGKPKLSGLDEYEKFKNNYLYTEDILSDEAIDYYAREQKQKGTALFMWIWGFFWAPRHLLGIEEHLMTFYDDPELMDRINTDQLAFIKKTVERVSKKVKLQFVVLGEDMSYKSGSMISKSMFEERLMPFYSQIVPFLHGLGIKAFIDSDGLVDDPVEWYANAGFDGMLPMERQAGVDLNKYREKFPNFCFVGGFDKRTMYQGEAAMRSEFERLLPVMKQGGYILGVDHQTPPEVSIDDYRLYLKLLWEYAKKVE